MTKAQKVVLVTGSTSGIGLAIAKRFASDNYAVAVNSFESRAHATPAISEISENGSGSVDYFEMDLAAPAAGITLVEQVIARFGRIDVLVNNAGIQKVAPIEDFSLEDWEQVRTIVLDACFQCMRAAVPDMAARGKGRIINIASAHGLRASPFKSAYVAAKHGVIGLTKTIALETAEKGITVNAICPGYVWTPLVEKQLNDQAKAHNLTKDEVIRQIMLAPQPNKAFIQPEEIAELTAYLASDWGRSITGSAISIDGGWTAK